MAKDNLTDIQSEGLENRSLSSVCPVRSFAEDRRPWRSNGDGFRQHVGRKFEESFGLSNSAFSDESNESPGVVLAHRQASSIEYEKTASNDSPEVLAHRQAPPKECCKETPSKDDMSFLPFTAILFVAVLILIAVAAYQISRKPAAKIRRRRRGGKEPKKGSAGGGENGDVEAGVEGSKDEEEEEEQKGYEDGEDQPADGEDCWDGVVRKMRG